MRAVLALVLLCAAVLPALAAPDDFASFWQSFSQAAGKNDRAALQAMTKFPFLYQDKPREAAEFDILYKGLLGPKARTCLAKAKPVKDQDSSYDAFCGETIYIFTKDSNGWRFSEFGAND
jgi:hypothetical protein